MDVRCRAWFVMVSVALSAVLPAQAEQQAAAVKVLDGKTKIIVVNGYSTSFQWPRILERKLSRFFSGKSPVRVRRALKGGTPIARWIDVKTGRPRDAWSVVRKALTRDDQTVPVIVLAQQSLQGVYGGFRVGIRGKDDAERIKQGADALEKYARLLRNDGADAVFIAMHIYKHPLEPAIGNERLALAELMKRRIPGLYPGPDVWTPTKALYPKAFAADELHPNWIGAEVMAQLWFEALLTHDGLAVPAWSRAEMDKAVKADPSQRPVRRRRDRPGRSPERVPPNVQVHRDVEYARAGHQKLLLNVYVPKWTAGPLPLVVWIHGGAWRGGDKGHCPALGIIPRGYVVASVNYRLSGTAKFPAQIHDCKAAVRFLRANAVKYKIDPKRVGVWGSSAGGHLAALLGTSGDVKRLEGDLGGLNESSRVQAACTWSGPSDLTRLTTPGGRGPVAELLGGPPASRKDLAAQANPITHVSKDDPPFLLMHGDRDRTVPLAQARLLHDALTRAGVDATLEVIRGAGHGLRSPRTVTTVAEFFDKHLKRK